MCLHTKKSDLVFTVRKVDDKYRDFLILANKFSRIVPTGTISFLSLHSHIRKLLKLITAETKRFESTVPGRRPKNHSFFRSISGLFLSSGKSLFSISDLYLSLTGQSKNTCKKVSEGIGLWSLLTEHKLHSASIP